MPNSSDGRGVKELRTGSRYRGKLQYRSLISNEALLKASSNRKVRVCSLKPHKQTIPQAHIV